MTLFDWYSGGLNVILVALFEVCGVAWIYGIHYSVHFLYFLDKAKLKAKVLPEPQGPMGGADLRFNSPQPHTSRSCKSTDTGHPECLFSSQLAPVPIYTAW